MHAAPFGGSFRDRQCDVDGFGIEPSVEHRGGKSVLCCLNCRRDALLEPIDGRPFRLAFLRRHRAEGPEQASDRTALSEGSNANGLKRRFVLRGVYARQDLFFKFCDVGHGLRPLSCRAVSRQIGSVPA